MSLKFCANLSFMFQETPSLLERYALAKAAGFRGVECARPYEVPIEDIVAAKTKAGVEQILINVPPGDLKKGENGMAAIPGRETEFSDNFNLAVKYAKALNCKRIHITSGIVENPKDVHVQTYLKNIKQAASILEKEGLLGVIEPINNITVPNYFMNSFENGLDVVKSVNSPNLKLQLDIFHLQHICGNLTHSIKHYLPYVGHIQIAQVPDRNEPNTPGEINYPYVFSLLQQLSYDGWIGLEYKPAQDTKGGLKWIQEYGFQL